MGGISIWRLLIIAVIVVLPPGAKKLDSIGSDFGASIKGFKKTMSGDESEQDKTNQGANSTAKATADKQANTDQKQVETEGAKRHDREQVRSVFGIDFSGPLLMFIINLVVLRPQRLLVAVKAVAGWIRALRSLATMVQNELTQELRPQELQDGPEKVEKASLANLAPEPKTSMDESRQAAGSIKHSYVANDPKRVSDEAHTVHNPVVKDDEAAHKGIMSTAAQAQANSSEQKPETTPEPMVKPAADAEPRTTAPSPSSSGGLQTRL